MLDLSLPLGLRDLTPDHSAHLAELSSRLHDVFTSFKYRRLLLPTLERLEVIERGLSPSALAAVLKFVEPGSGEVVAIRPDITPQIARIAATLAVAQRIALGFRRGPLEFDFDRRRKSARQTQHRLLRQARDPHVRARLAQMNHDGSVAQRIFDERRTRQRHGLSNGNRLFSCLMFGLWLEGVERVP